MKSYIRRIRCSSIVGHLGAPGIYAVRSTQNTSMVVLWLPTRFHSTSPRQYTNPSTAGWGQYQSCLQQYLSVSPQQSAQIAQIATILANEGRKVIPIRNNNSLSNVQKLQAIKAMHQQFDQQLKAILSSAQYDKLKVGRQQAMRWATQARLGWQ